MSNVWTGARAKVDMQEDKPQARWQLGLLKPVISTWMIKGLQDPKSHEVDEKEFDATPRDTVKWKGQRLAFEIDPTVLDTSKQYTDIRSTMVGFGPWRDIVKPSILDVAGSVETFADRADSMSWFVEAEIVATGETYTPAVVEGEEPKKAKQVYTFRFTRMTQSEAEIRAWLSERYPKAAPSDEAIKEAQAIWKMAKGDTTKFSAFIGDDETLSGHLPEFLEMSSSW